MDKNLSNSIEIDGSSVEEAINKAMKILKVKRHQMIIKIVCEEKKGLFGMEGQKPAKIKATIKENYKNS